MMGMKIWKRGLAVASYLLLLSVLLKFQIRLLWDVRQFFLVLTGAGILYAFFVREQGKKEKKEKHKAQDKGCRKKGHWRISYREFGECALWSSFLETFLLLFLSLDKLEGIEGIFLQLSPNLRPLLYGFCIWQVMAYGEDTRGGEMQKEERAASDSYQVWRKLGLTRREQEIAILVCQGRSNREIAENLYIAESTVKKHLSNIFEKLGIDRRDQLRSFLDERD